MCVWTNWVNVVCVYFFILSIYLFIYFFFFFVDNTSEVWRSETEQTVLVKLFVFQTLLEWSGYQGLALA